MIVDLPEEVLQTLYDLSWKHTMGSPKSRYQHIQYFIGRMTVLGMDFVVDDMHYSATFGNDGIEFEDPDKLPGLE